MKISKGEVLNIIDEVMNNREIDSIRNAILAIRDKVIDLDDPGDINVGFNQVKIELRGNNRLCETSPWFDGATYAVIDPTEKIDTGIYGSIMYGKEDYGHTKRTTP